MESLSWLSDQGAKVLIEQLQEAVVAVEDEKIVYANQPMADIMECTTHEIVGRTFIDLVAPVDLEKVIARHRARLAGANEPDHYLIRLRTIRGKEVVCDMRVSMTVNRAGKRVTVASGRDVTQQFEAQERLLKANDELRRIYNQLPDIYYRTDMDGILTMISPASKEILGYEPGEAEGKPLSSFYKNPEDRDRAVNAILAAAGKAVQVEVELRRKDGSIVCVLANSTVHYGQDGVPLWIEGVARDISARKKMEEQLMELARTDGLTSLYSRSYFIEQSEEIIRLMRRHKRPLTVMIADLDHFKRINDTHGHLGGDKVLVAFAATCRKVIRESDLLGRLGGEEFGLVLPETPLQQAMVMAERLREATSAIEVMLDGERIHITVSIGLVEMRQEEMSISTLLRRADHELYRAKEEGRDRVCYS